MTKLLRLVKKSLSIAEESIVKDDEIQLYINAGKEDLKRQNIKIDYENPLIVSAIVLYTKGNFGNTDLKEKEQAMSTYQSLCYNLALSEDYKNDSN